MSGDRQTAAPDVNAALRAALDRAASFQRERDAAVRERDQVRGQLRVESGGRLAAQEIAIDNAIAHAETERAGLQRDWANLQAEGKFEEAGAVLAKMTDAAARIAQYRGQKEYVAQQRAAAPSETEAPTIEAPPPAPVYSAAEQSWIERNPQYLSDPAFKARVDGAYVYATTSLGKARGSEDAIREVDRLLGLSAAPPAPATDPAPDNAAGNTAAADAPQGAMPRHDTIDAGVKLPTIEAPAMRIPTADNGASQPEDLSAVDERFPHQPAIGKGGAGIRSVAAPPTRDVQNFSNRAAQGRYIEPTADEYELSQLLYQQINGTDPETPEAAVRWYHAAYNSPSAQRKRQRWAQMRG